MMEGAKVDDCDGCGRTWADCGAGFFCPPTLRLSVVAGGVAPFIMEGGAVGKTFFTGISWFSLKFLSGLADPAVLPLSSPRPPENVQLPKVCGLKLGPGPYLGSVGLAPATVAAAELALLLLTA